MQKRTYESTTEWRASEIDSGGHLTYRDTIFEDGTIYWSVRGTADGEYVDSRGVRQAECTIDWERIHKARVSMGWRLVEECTCGDASCVLCDDDGLRPAEARS